MKSFLTGFLVLLAAISWAQKDQLTLSGVITDAENGETLIGASVAIVGTSVGTITNEYGFYSISFAPVDSVTVEFSYVGYQSQQKRLTLTANTKLNISLGTGVDLEEVVVKANSYQEQLNSTEMSVETLSKKEVKNIPAVLGETDILRALQLKPGIPSGSEGTTGLFVRGGAADQNLIVLDEAIVYNANHLFGFFSTFNTDAVKDLKLYKGGFPSQYGGRLSSVIDVKLNEGNKKQLSGAGGLGIISSRLTLEGPIVKDKASFMVSGRRTYFDLITKGVNEANKDKEDYNPIPAYYFYDLNTKINYQLSDKDHLYLSGYFGRDVFGFDGDFFDFNFDWGNATGTARWNHQFNPKLFANTTFTFSDYQYNIQNKITGFEFNLGSNIQDINLKTDLYHVASNNHTLRYGLQATHHTFTVGRLKAGSNDGEVSFSSGKDYYGVETGAYIADEWVVNSDFKISSGLRLSGFVNEGQWYSRLEPRLAMNYKISERVAVKGSYARMNQYLHLVANAGVALPTDVWYPSTKLVKPQGSDQVAAGISYLAGKDFFFNVEGYYKKLYNQLEFVDGAALFANDDLEQEFAIGKGEAYGFEFSVEKNAGRLTGWIGYTLSKSIRSDFKTIDPLGRFAQTEPFAPIYDRRHDISVVTIYEINRRLSASATFVYGTGDRRWLPAGRFSFQDVGGQPNSPVVPDYQDRNTFRMPAYQRLDLGLVWKFFPKWGESDLTFNVINALDYRNAFFIYLEPEFQKTDVGGELFEIPTRIAAKQVSLFPILPAITWNFKF